MDDVVVDARGDAPVEVPCVVERVDGGGEAAMQAEYPGGCVLVFDMI